MHVTKAAPNMVPALLHSCPKTLRNPSVPLRTRLQLKLFMTVLKLQTVSLLAPSMPFLSLYLCRYVDQVLPLGRYDWLESYCRLLQHDAAEGALRADTFLGCAELLQIGGAGSLGRRFAVVTGHSLVGFETESAAEAQEAGVGASCFVCHDRCVLLASADRGCSHILTILVIYRSWQVVLLLPLVSVLSVTRHGRTLRITHVPSAAQQSLHRSRGDTNEEPGIAAAGGSSNHSAILGSVLAEVEARVAVPSGSGSSNPSGRGLMGLLERRMSVAAPRAAAAPATDSEPSAANSAPSGGKRGWGDAATVLPLAEAVPGIAGSDASRSAAWAPGRDHGSWVCLAQLELQSVESAEKLHALLERHLAQLEAQRRASACLMLGF